jgi:hypothetical protein
MRSPLPLLAVAALAACEGAAPAPPPPALMDVSGDDCTASALVYDRPSAEATAADPGTAFLNDGCAGDRVFLGIDGERRELTRAEDAPLGTGGPYADGAYALTVVRRALATRVAGDDTECHDPAASMFDLAWDVEVRIRARSGAAWTVDGTLREWECVP